MNGRLRHYSLLAFTGLLVSCGPKEPASRAGPASPALEVEFSGCSAFYLSGPVCAVWPDPQVKLWVRAAPGSQVEILADGRKITASGTPVRGGLRYLLSLPPQASRLAVSVARQGGERIGSWSLRLAEPDMPAWLAEIKGLTSQGQREAARRRLQQLRQTAPRKEQGLVLRSLAYIARAHGDSEEEAMFLRQGWSADRAARRWSGEVEHAIRLTGLYLEQGRFSEARQTLGRLTLPPEAPADAKYLVAYHQGLLSDAVGDYRSALAQLRRAEELAEKVGMIKYKWTIQQVLARLLQDLGRSAEASELFARLRADPHPSNPCDLGTLLINSGWSRLLAREADEKVEDPTPTLEEARAEFDAHQCLPGERLNARLNLALAHQQTKRWPAARRALREAGTLSAVPNLRQRLWWDDLEARMAIAEGHPQRALGLYQQLASTAARADSTEGSLRAFLGQAHARLALGQPSLAIADLAEADRRIDEQSARIPAHEGRDTFIAQREAVTRLYLELLLAGGRREAAFALARRARSRLLRQLAVDDRLAQLTPEEQRRWAAALSAYWSLRNAIDRQAAVEWQLAADAVGRAREAQAEQLAASRDALDRALSSLGDPGAAEGEVSLPRPGEVILAYHPLLQGWVGFAATGRGIEAATFDLAEGSLADPARLAHSLLAPFRATLHSAERVRVLPYGRLRSVDFHALPFEGEPLLARHLVVYSLDLPVRATPASLGSRMALVVSNPQNDLPATRQEAAAVAATIGAWGSGWSSNRLDGSQTRAEAVRAMLPAAGLFHYAGHGIFAGFAGWNSELPLADGSRLTLGDVLALRRAPAWVVLSACDAGRSSEQAPVEGLGLANAFLLAGSQAVVAARRPVADRSTRELMRELYRGWRPGTDLARQLQRAQLSQRLTDPKATAAWASFRLLVP